MDWPADDQPFWLHTRAGLILALPDHLEVNDSASIIRCHNTASEFADMIVAQFDELVEQCVAQPLVMILSLHPFVVGQPFRMGALRRALQHCVEHLQRDRVWWTRPDGIADLAMACLPAYCRGRESGAMI